MSIKIMSDVWELDIPRPEKFILIAMADHADHDGNNVYPSVPRIAWKTGYDERQVRRIIDSLETLKILVPVVKENGKAAVYSIRTGHIKRNLYPCQNVTPVKMSPLTFTTDTPGIMPGEPLTFTTDTPGIIPGITVLNDNEPSDEPSTVAPSTPKQVKSAIPSLEEVEAYFVEKGWSVKSASLFWHYWESVSWKRQGKTMTKWKAAAFQWDKKEDEAAGPARIPSVNVGPIIKEVETAFQSKAYHTRSKFDPSLGRSVVTGNFPVWSDPAVGKAVDSMGGFFKLRERVTQGSVQDHVWKGQFERYYRQEKQEEGA